MLNVRRHDAFAVLMKNRQEKHPLLASPWLQKRENVLFVSLLLSLLALQSQLALCPACLFVIHPLCHFLGLLTIQHPAPEATIDGTWSPIWTQRDVSVCFQHLLIIQAEFCSLKSLMGSFKATAALVQASSATVANSRDSTRVADASRYFWIAPRTISAQSG